MTDAYTDLQVETSAADFSPANAPLLREAQADSPTSSDLAANCATALAAQPAALAAAPSAPADEADATDAASSAEPNGFVQLGLSPQLVQAVADLGYVQPTRVQAQTIPLALPDAEQTDPNAQGYNDLMVSSQTGSGKTAAFLLPVLHTLIAQQAAAQAQDEAEYELAKAQALARGEAAPKRTRRKDPTNPRNFKAAVPGALVLCPTRELAQQVAHDAIDLVKHSKGLRVANVVGGIPYPVQIAKLQNANLVVATPGRLLDLQRSMQIKLDEVQFLVVDEADRMLDLGFSDDLAEINQLTSQRRQTMMFSATFAPRIQQLAMRVMHDGGSSVRKIQIDNPQEKHASIQQVLFWADNLQHKRKLLDHWLREPSIDQAIVFASTQIECDGLATELQQAGFAAVALHGALSQGLRNRRLMALRNGQVQILVATDVAARGIDVPTITHVFNFGLPMKAEDYTHRIGRTGRAGRTGLAVTFAEFRDRRKIADIEFYTKQNFKAEVIPGLEPQQRFEAPRGKSAWGNKPGKGSGRFERNAGPAANDWGKRGKDRPEAARGAGKFEPRFEARGEPRFDGRFEGRFEGRTEGATDKRFDNNRFDKRSDNRFEARNPQSRADGRFDARAEPRFGKPTSAFAHPDSAPAWRRGPAGDGRSAGPRQTDKAAAFGRERSHSPQHTPHGAGGKFAERSSGERSSRGPKQIGGGFKPHSPKRRP